MELDIKFDPARVLAFLRAWPAYAATPLRTMAWNGGALFIKDETGRMGLGSFKALGGPYAVARILEDEKGRDAARTTFVCASAGNHGMAVAAGARRAGAKARVYLCETVPEVFAERLQAQGAEVARAGKTYEESLAAAEDFAAASGGILLSDTGADAADKVPLLVMEGYTALAEELRESFTAQDVWPTHVFVQAGVGGLAAALAVMIRTTWPVQARIVVVEPEAAPCLQASHAAGRPVTVAGPVSNMGRLDCKEPSYFAFEALRALDVAYQTVSDAAALDAAHMLHETFGIASTPSGAAGFAALRAAHLGGTDTRPLIIVTEGAV